MREEEWWGTEEEAEATATAKSRTGALDELVAVVFGAADEVARLERAVARAADALRGAAANALSELAVLRDAALVLARLLCATVQAPGTRVPCAGRG